MPRKPKKDGSVRNVKAGGDLADHDVVRCTVRAIERLSFPSPNPPRTVTVTYPIVFVP